MQQSESVIHIHRSILGRSGKESTCQCRRPRSNLWVGKIRLRGKWQPTPVGSCLENPMDRGAEWATVHGVTKESDTTQQLNSGSGTGIRMWGCWVNEWWLRASHEPWESVWCDMIFISETQQWAGLKRDLSSLMDENQESRQLIHQGPEARSKVAQALVWFESKNVSRRQRLLKQVQSWLLLLSQHNTQRRSWFI